MRTFFSWQLSAKDKLSSRLSISRFQYDTPDTKNYDDRDEFRATAILGLSHRFNPGLQIYIQTRTNLHHLVYIFNQKSANNKWNRILQFSTTLNYMPNESFRLGQNVEVLANYTNYDFEDIQSQIRSFVYRKYTISDSLKIGKLQGVQINLFHRMEFEENGRLFWDNFSEELLLSRRNHYLTFGVQFPLIGDLLLYNGLTAYFRREWRYKHDQFGKLKREKWGDFYSYGPQIRIFFRNSQNQDTLISLSRFRVQTRNDQVYFINQISLNANWYF